MQLGGKDIEAYIPNFKRAIEHFIIHTGGRAVSLPSPDLISILSLVVLSHLDTMLASCSKHPCSQLDAHVLQLQDF